MSKQLIIFCSHPGLIRAGAVHPLVKAHDPARFTLAQYVEMLAEPSLVLAMGEMVSREQIEADLGHALPTASGRGRLAGDMVGAHPVEVGLAGPTARRGDRGMELGLSSDLARRHVADEIVLRDRTGQAVVREDGTEALPVGGPEAGFARDTTLTLDRDAFLGTAALAGEPVEAAAKYDSFDAIADELAVRAIEDSARDVITGQPTPAPLADDIIAEPGDTEVQRRVEDVASRAAGRHRARRT